MSEREWQRTDTAPEGVEVETKIDDERGVRNIQALRRRGNLWRGRVFCEAPLEPSDEGKTVTRWIALRHGEARPGVGVCAKCGTETAHVPGLGIGQRCGEHRSAR